MMEPHELPDMTPLLIIAGLGNAIDTLSTLHLHGQGYVEANPVMAALLPHPWLFVLVKLGVFTALLLWLWHRRAKQAAAIAAVVYGAVAVYYGAWFMFF